MICFTSTAFGDNNGFKYAFFNIFCILIGGTKYTLSTFIPDISAKIKGLLTRHKMIVDKSLKKIEEPDITIFAEHIDYTVEI